MNGWRGVYLFVEGQDDALFAERLLKPRLEMHFEFVAVIAYASTRQAILAQQARAIQKSGAQLWVIADYDRLFARMLSRQLRTELLLSLLDSYDWEVALQRSDSLRYCATKLGIVSGESV
jgi:hypothetical protein